LQIHCRETENSKSGPSSLTDILSDIRCVGEALGVVERAETVVEVLAKRINAVKRAAMKATSRHGASSWNGLIRRFAQVTGIPIG